MGDGIKGIVVAATKSGSGKTTVTLGLMAALVRRGIAVAPFKVGPDFIDPGHHTRITGNVSRNLDGWMLSQDYNINCLEQNVPDGAVAVAEGVMGLFDGYDGKSDAGSTAQMAKWLDFPVLLVVDARSMARSAAAIVQGFENFDRNLKFAGVVFNNVGSDRHLLYLKQALEGTVGMKYLGGIFRDKSVEIPERHLGLVTTEDHPVSKKNSGRLADLVENSMDVGRLLDSLPVKAGHIRKPEKRITRQLDVRIGVASDNAFCFYYQDNIELFRTYGARVIFFSPIEDKQLPDDLDGIYLGGGYPELFAERLASNRSLRHQIKAKSHGGMPIYGECGGFMYLCRELSDLDGNTFPMTGCFPMSTRMFKRLKALGYRETILKKDTILGTKGQKIRGHEFHYSEIIDISEKIDKVYDVVVRKDGNRKEEGFQIRRTLGSYLHLHFGSQPKAAYQFLTNCAAFKAERMINHETQ
jgi:cobyrinic acid a,c-diamide synthase